jgi:hypothetical protein
VGGKDAASAWLRGHRVGDCTSVASRHTLVTKASMILCCRRGTANRHAETLVDVRISCSRSRFGAYLLEGML